MIAIVPDKLRVFYHGYTDRDAFLLESGEIPNTEPAERALSYFGQYGIILEIDRHDHLSVEFSPSLVSARGSHNLNNLTEDQYLEQIETVSQLIADYGLTIDLRKGIVSKFHTAINCICPMPFKAYVPELRLLDFSSKYQRQVGTTYYYNTKQAKIAVYDKMKECRFKKYPQLAEYPIPPEFLGKNVMRWEYRVEAPAKFRSLTKLRYAGESHLALPIIADRFRKEVEDAFRV